MSEAIVVALIASAGGLIGSLVGMVSNKNMIEYKLEQLTKKVDAHNKVVERTYELEKRTDVQEEKITQMDHRIDALENKIA